MSIVRGKHRGFVRPEESARREQLEVKWSRTFGTERPSMDLRWQFPDRCARFHVRGPGDTASDLEASDNLRALLLDLPAKRGEPMCLIVEEYGVNDLSGGWSKALSTDLFAWRRIPRDEYHAGTAYYWAGTIHDKDVIEAVLMKAALEEGYFVLTDAEVSWAFCPFWYGVDIIFGSSRERDEFVDAHRDLSPPDRTDL